MDPLSITATVISLTARCTATSIQLYNTFKKYRQAPQTIASLVEETQVIKASLGQVERALEHNPNGLSTQDLADIFDIAIKGCRATLLCLEEEFKKLKDRKDWGARVLTLWKEDAMKELVEQLGRKKQTLTLLIQGLQLQSSIEIQQLIRAGRPELERAKNDIASLIPTYPNVAIPLLESIDRISVNTLLGSGASIISTTEFTFDDVVLNSKVYRDTLTRLAAAQRIPSPKSARALATEEDLIDFSDNTPMTSATTIDNTIFQDLEGLRISSNSNEDLGEHRNSDLEITTRDSKTRAELTKCLRYASKLPGIYIIINKKPMIISDKDRTMKISEMDESKRVLGKEDPNTLASMHNLALTYHEQGRWKEAEELGVEVVEARKRVLGKEDPNTLASMHNLVLIYWNQERWKEAEELEVEVVEASKRVLGKEHPNTLASMYTLALIYRKQERWKEAEELGVEVVEARKRVLGKEDPNTLASMHNLASIYGEQGRLKEAEELGVEVVEARKRVLGQEHLDTLRSMNNLVLTYWKQGRWKEAERLGVEVVEARKRVLGQEHPDTLSNMHHLALTYYKQGRQKKAKTLMSKVYSSRIKTLGADHSGTKSSLRALKKWERST